MGFKENLKEVLSYKGMMVKELAAFSGVSRHTLDNYLSVKNCQPSAESAVKIAKVLGVSVEYLMEGEECSRKPDERAKLLKFGAVIDDLAVLPGEVLGPIKTMIKAAASEERRKRRLRSGSTRGPQDPAPRSPGPFSVWQDTPTERY